MPDHLFELPAMHPTRRAFLATGALSFCALSGQAAETANAGKSMAMPPLDYGLSFICHSAAMNSVRFWVESRTRLIDDRDGTWTDFYQCAACKSENTFAARDLFMKDNYDFTPIFGGGNVLVFRRPAHLSERYRVVKKADEMWGEPTLKLREGARVQEVATWEAIAQATADAVPLVSQTEIANPEIKLRAIIECPVKTMNIEPGKKLYQVDTGPVAFPDLSKRCEPAIDTFSLAYIAFNAPDFADFVVEQPTPVSMDGTGTPQIYHYSKLLSLTAKNRIFTVNR